jgi:hypothetical protein
MRLKQQLDEIGIPYVLVYPELENPAHNNATEYLIHMLKK